MFLIIGGADGSDSATNCPIYFSPGTQSLWLDDRALVAEQMLTEAAMNGNLRGFQPEDQPEELGAQGPYATTDFYLYPISLASNFFNVILYGTTNGSNYLITSTEFLDPATNSVWLVEGTLQGGTNDGTQFALGIALRTNNLFIRAQACDDACAATNLPLAWQLAYFGVTGVDPNGDYDGDGVNNLAEFLNGTDPNKIVFSLSISNQYMAASAVPVQVNIAGGVPSYIAVLVNDGNTTNATWQPFTTTSLSVPLPTNGTYVITVGLCGLATNATQSWQALTVFRDSTPLTLAVTNLPVLSGSRPFIDPAGYASRSLSSLTWTVLDGNGGTNNGNGIVVAQGWNLSDRYHTTNCWACVDLPLALGTNWVSIQAADWAGTVAVTNFTYVFDTNGDTTPPALSLVWPQDGTQVSSNSFTLQAWTDDDKAAVALQYTDGDGVVQTVSGLVERGGNVWVPDVPLLAGTNNLSLLATDAAGNVSTNTFSMVQTNVDLTIFPVSDALLPYAYVAVSGWVSDPAATVTVNGVVATVLASGDWVAYNVPLQPGGVVTLLATAQLSDGATVQTLLKQARGPIVFTQNYNYALGYTRLGWTEVETNGFGTVHIDFHWARGLGGTNTETSSWLDFDNGILTSNCTVTVWPPDPGYTAVELGS